MWLGKRNPETSSNRFNFIYFCFARRHFTIREDFRRLAGGAPDAVVPKGLGAESFLPIPAKVGGSSYTGSRPSSNSKPSAWMSPSAISRILSNEFPECLLLPETLLYCFQFVLAVLVRFTGIECSPNAWADRLDV
jgi:hypothetical protein